MLVIRIATAAALVGALLAGCADAKSNAAAAKPSASGGNAVAVGSFDSVELNGGGHVTLRYGAAQRVTLVSGSTEFTRFHIEDGHKLVIDTCNGNCPQRYDLEVEIVTPHIEAVAIDGGGRLETVAGFPAQGAITAAVNGGGTIDVRSIDAKSGTAAIDGGGKIRVRAEQRLTAAIDGGGAIRYAGNANVTSAIDGGGTVQHE